MIDKLIKQVSKHHTLGLKELLISSSFSFQNTFSIEDNMDRCSISIFANEQTPMGLKKEDYDELFDARHMVIHTFSKTDLDIKTYLERIWHLFEHVLNSLHSNPVSFYLLKVAALHDTKRYREAIKCFHNIETTGPTNHWLHYFVGDSFKEINDDRSAKKHLEISFDQKHLVECAKKYSDQQINDSNELELMLFDISLLYTSIGESFVAMGENDLAMESLKCAIRNQP